MLQLFVDESDSNDPPVYMMSGVLSTADRWRKLFQEWQEALDMPLRLQYFKMSEAMACSGEFLGFSQTRRNERLQMLVNILTEHAIAILSCILPHDVYRDLFTHPGVPKYLQNPYCFLFYGMLFRIPKFREAFNLEGEIDIIFDDQIGVKERLLDSFAQIKDRLPLVGAPTFKNDQKCLPLQAAGRLEENGRAPTYGRMPPESQRGSLHLLGRRLYPVCCFRGIKNRCISFWEKFFQTGRGSYAITLTYADGRTEIIKGGHREPDKGS